MSSDHVTPSAADALYEEVVACADRTLSASLVRIELSRSFEFSWPPDDPYGPRRRGGLLRPVGKLVARSGKAAFRRWIEKLADRHMSGGGIVEPTARRHMVDYGCYAELQKDGTFWNGLAGRPIDTLAPSPVDRGIDLWWLLDALRGTTAATMEGEEAVHGTTCRRIAARVDLDRASALAPEGLRVPHVERFEELKALPLTVWIDDRHIRRVTFEEGGPGSTELTLDLVEFDPAVGDLDWTRLPTFRCPEEAAYVASQDRAR